jgi:CheY-like chemotaxis protein
VGRGTTFDLYFPLLSTPVPLPPSSEPKIKTRSISERGHQILLIDDEAVVREVACKMLEGLGYQVTVCSDGVQALDLYRSDWKRFDLVLLDVVMPHISGREVFERLVAINPAVKVLVISGYSLAGDVQELLHQGASGFIQKPFQMAALDKAVQLALRGNPSQVDDSSSTFG